jgi:hypothetical protein
MTATSQPRRPAYLAVVGGGLLMVLGCAIGPAVIGAVAGSAIGGWLGIACAVILAAAVATVACSSSALAVGRRVRGLPSRSR